ncbi:GGDEF domain-containing protein [Undibacterium terreum]|uniref:diguanylate cyclase n=1 Tax=Undibacterium terreum TaxID=1224302 RepID=A0A916UAZ6_9BURK|nr:diguanylate cyclase [Undibacterium terreum]GGC66296.1 sensor domain-containing diguanylate cyclase [Undibacterium terreum]
MPESKLELDSDNAVYRTLLESTKAIPWKIDWATMKFAYIGPQIEPLLGWKQDSWLTVDDWATRMHPEDRDYVVNFCVSQSKAGVDHEADYRALTKNDGYVWIRDVVHVVRNEQGEVDSLIGFMFDISERKKGEEKLVALQKELEALSFKDSLTGVANRRKFESVLDTEWASARRNGQPLSLIVVDVDFFKQYNDYYGHIRGDECLKQIAQALGLSVTRSRDLVARFGGEEFVLVLPETDAEAVLHVAERCKRKLENLQIPHEASSIGRFVTASMGVGTIRPSPEMESKHFVEAVDKLLYKAKQNGRNRIEFENL